MKTISLYTDGSCLNNGNNGTGGYCAIVQDLEYDETIIVKGSQANTTNNRMEMMAIIKGVEALNEPSKITIYSDASILVNAINTWLDTWINKGFKKIANVDLWKRYLDVAKPHQIKAIWVKAHSGNEYNEMCDRIATKEANNLLFGRMA